MRNTRFSPAIHRRSALRILLCALPLFSGCSALSPLPINSPGPAIEPDRAPVIAPVIAPAIAPVIGAGSVPRSRLHAAYVVIGENGSAWARTISPAEVAGEHNTECPIITVDGAARRMSVRAAAGVIAQRPTASDAAHSRASVFPILTCEFSLPEKTASATVEGIELRLPKPESRRIVVLGDTGCRMKKADNAWQACLDEQAWPFRPLANAAAAFAPDLVIHLGDFHYRENKCPPDVAGCQGSPWGYGWDSWDADLFLPGTKLLAAAPWVVARGNHEECRRAGQGWFRFLDPRPFEETRSCNEAKNDLIGNFTPPYAVPISHDLQLIVFDSAYSGNDPLKPSRPRDAFAFNQYRQQFILVDALAAKAGVNSIFINHHPILGYSSDRASGVSEGAPAMLSVLKSLHPLTYYPPTVKLALHGHVHLFEAINFSSNHPATIVSGVGGDETYVNLPDPFPLDKPPAEGVTLESITHTNEFGFLVMDKLNGQWQVGAYDQHGMLRTTCILAGSKLRCDKTGLLK